MAPRFCANLTMMFGEASSLLERYQLAKTAGFAAVECAFPYDTPKEDLAKVKSSLGLEQVLINTFPGNTLGFAALVGKQAEFMDSLKKSIDYCQALQCPRLHIMAGKISNPSDATEEVFLENLKSAVPLLEQAGITGVIEPINGYSVPGYFLNNFELGERLVNTIDSPHLRLQLDIFHLQFLRGDLTNSIKRFLPITGHVQIAQVPHRHEPDSAGEINYKYVLDTLDKEGYKGWVGLEYIPAAPTVDGLSWINDYGYSIKSA